MELLLLAVATTVAAAITFGGLIKKLMGAPVAVDIAASSYFLTTYAATGTISGLTIGVLSVLIVSVAIRLWRWAFGYQRIVVNGQREMGQVVAHLITGSMYWVRELVKTLFTGKPALPPSTIHVTWDYVPGAAYTLTHRTAVVA